MAGRLKQVLGGLVGQELWSAVTGPQGNYVLSLELGEKQRRHVRLANPRLSFVKRTFEGTHSLLVECPWRVDGSDRVVCSAFEAFEREAAPVREIGELTDRVVEAAEVVLPGGDLVLALGGGVVLRCFALEVRRRPERRNWTCWTPAGSFVVGPAGRIIEQTRTQAEAAFSRQLRALEGIEPSPLDRLERRFDEEAPEVGGEPEPGVEPDPAEE